MWAAIGAFSIVMMIVLIVVGVISAVRKKKAMRFFGGATLFFVLMIIAVVNTPVQSDEPGITISAADPVVEALADEPSPTIKPTPTATEAPKETAAPVVTSIDVARNAVHKAFGETNSFDNSDSIKEITLDQGKTLIIKVVGQDNLTDKMILFMMHSNIKDILQALHKNKDIGTIAFSILFPMQDKFGQQSMRVVMKTEFSPETREKIVWDNFVSDDIPAIADAYWHNDSFD
ncbi:hypothetical protein ACFWMP_14025 [Paenibacillus sp. NPDC058367]|uniref:hypothetical protein n=1 Tax=Paenibacillus sp. NPDC058367 TaxID=3346460 RepID=UPI00366729F6